MVLIRYDKPIRATVVCLFFLKRPRVSLGWFVPPTVVSPSVSMFRLLTTKTQVLALFGRGDVTRQIER